VAVLPVKAKLTRLTAWLLAAGLLDRADQNDREKVAEALWRAAELSIADWEAKLP
jgi:hypothetical protein